MPLPAFSLNNTLKEKCVTIGLQQLCGRQKGTIRAFTAFDNSKFFLFQRVTLAAILARLFTSKPGAMGTLLEPQEVLKVRALRVQSTDAEVNMLLRNKWQTQPVLTSFDTVELSQKNTRTL